MSVAVKQKITRRQVARRNMDETETPAVLLESELLRQVEAEVVVAEHGVKWTPDRETGAQTFQIAKVPEMPDFISLREVRQDFLRQVAMGVRDDGNAKAHG
jgi:hypothetical protein